MYNTNYELSSSSPCWYIACDFKYLLLAGGNDDIDADGVTIIIPAGLGTPELLEELELAPPCARALAMRSGSGGVVLPVRSGSGGVGSGDISFGGVTCPAGGGGLGGEPPNFPLFLAVGGFALGGGAGGNANSGGAGGGNASFGAGGKASKGARSFGKARYAANSSNFILLGQHTLRNSFGVGRSAAIKGKFSSQSRVCLKYGDV